MDEFDEVIKEKNEMAPFSFELNVLDGTKVILRKEYVEEIGYVKEDVAY